MQEFDIGIVGLGALGSSTAYHAAGKGASVIGFEQFEFGHVRGASHDTSRIVRTSYDIPEYVSLAKSAYKDWKALERATGLSLLEITGGLTFLATDGGLNGITVKDYSAALTANGVSFEVLTPEEVSRRWPQFNIPDGVDTVYCADTGIAHASRTVAAMQALARLRGAVLKERTRVDRIIPQSDGAVIVETSNDKFRVGKVVLTADAWTNKLLSPLKSELPLKYSQEQVTYFKPGEPSNYESSKFPVWIWGADHWFYGFPCYGEPTIKAGRHCGENWMAADQRTFVPSQELLQQLTDKMDSFMPDANRQVLRTVTCQYTLTPSDHFIMSPLDRYKNIIVGLGAAHAFKFTPVFGRVLAELAIDGKTNENISLFGIPKAAEAQIPSKL